MKRSAKKVLALSLAAVMMLALLTACGGDDSDSGSSGSNGGSAVQLSGKNLYEEGAKIAYIPISTAGITNVMVKLAFDDVLSVYKGKVTVDYFDAGYDTQTQITMVNDCVNQGYDAIFIECADPVSLATPVADAEAAGIPVITSNLTAETVHTLHIQGVDYLAGWTAAEALANDFGANSGKNVVIVDCPAAMAATNLQSNGFLDYMEANTNWVLLDDRNVDNFSQEGANTAMRDLLTKFDNIDFVFCVQDDLTAGVLQAIEGAGRNDGSITVFGNVGFPSTFSAMNSGNLYGLCWSDMYTQYSVAMQQALFFIQTGLTANAMGLTETPVIDIYAVAVTPENSEMYTVLSRWPLTDAMD